MSSAWKPFLFPDPSEVSAARKQFHQAIQNVGSIGRSFLEEKPGDVNANLEWDESLNRLAGRWIEGDLTFRSSFSLSEFSVLLVDEAYHTVSSFYLQGKKQKDVMVWLEEQIDLSGCDISELSLKLPYQIPEYPTAKGEPFGIENPLAGVELDAWFHNSNLVLQEITRDLQNASEVRCWPHHFDIASLVTVLDSGDPETSKSINLGMSPGDGSYNEPYFYISPWPYPVADLPDISNSGGHWHEENWIGAILKSSDISHIFDQEGQQQAVFHFFQSVYPVVRNLIGD